MFYHPNKRAAIEAGAHLTDRWDVRAELEPHNGWVTVIAPLSVQVLEGAHLSDLMDHYEIDVGRLRRRPAEYKKPKQAARTPTPRGTRVTTLPPPPPPPVAKPAPAPVKSVLPPPPPPR